MYEQQFNPYGSNLAIVKGYFRSGKVLTLGILYIVSVIVNIFMATSISYDALIYQIISLLGREGVSIPSEVRYAIMNSSSSTTIVSIISASIVPILTALAFIIIFAKSRSTSEVSSPSAGITILRVLSIITFVFTIIGVVILGIVIAALLILAIYAVDNYGSNTATMALTGMIIVGVIYVAFAIISIIYAASYKNFFRSAKRSITTPNLENKGAVAYGVFSIIFAVLSVSGMIYNIVLFPASAGIILLSYVIQLLLYIFTAIVAIGYGKYINRHKNSINTTPYGGAAFAPAPEPTPMYNTPYYSNPQQNSPYQNAPRYEEQTYVPQPKAQFCPNCGAKIDSDAPFCPNCGTKL